ncbi:lysostaphin resistance A-like protein [Oceanicaulis sp. LC35]|uniref:CPBP family intramembrane glutamic endopeptidase n=1 Tax=Oceanicaulis sp. LC35 TaxID=3349635 RepID=UPI003F836221
MNGQVQLREAALGIVAVIGGYFLVGYALKFTLGHAAIGGYTISWSVWASLVLSLGVMVYVCKRDGSLDSLGLTRPRSILKGGLTGLVGGALILAGVALPVSLLSAAGLISPPEGASTLLVDGPNARLSLALSLAVMWINAAFGEELLFRGFLMNTLMRALGDTRRAGVAASLLIALAFGVMHMPSQGLYGLVVTGIVGFLMGVLFLFGKRNLLPVVLAHGLINTVSMVAASAG